MIRAEDFCKRVFDGTHETPKPCETGYKLLTSKNILDGFLDKSNAYYISEEDYNSINQRSGVQTWDILFSMIGTVGNVCLIQDSKIDFAIKNMGVFSCEDEWKAKWLYFYFQSPYAKSVIKNYLNGAVQKFLPLEVLRAFPVPQFDCNKEYITKFLWPIERKLSLNRKINAMLEAMAKTLYDYWFVQFDFPDEKGRPYKTSGGKMVYNEELGREIPAGWEVVPLTAVCKIVDCLHSQKPNQFYESEKFFLLQLENIVPLGLVDIRNKYYVKSADYELWTSKIEIQEGDLLITNAGRVGAFSRVPKGIRAGIGRNITAIRPQQVSAIYFYYYLHSVDCKRQIRLNTDVGAFFDSLNVKGLKNMYVLLPPKRLMQLFDKQGGYCRERLESAAKESEQLAALRDWLLPMLMNGQVGFRGKG